MLDFQLNIPVAFIIFNRPETTARVFAEIAKAKPAKLLVVADGPRTDKAGLMSSKSCFMACILMTLLIEISGAVEVVIFGVAQANGNGCTYWQRK